MSFTQDFQHRAILNKPVKVVPKINPIFRTPTITKRTPAFTSTDNSGKYDLSLFTSQAPRGPFPNNWSLVDGSPNASPGTPQLPTYFTGLFGTNYAAVGGARPPWSVAGVDYRVGPRGTLVDYVTWWNSIGAGSNTVGVAFAGVGQGFVFGSGGSTASSNLIIQGVDFTGDSGSGSEAYTIINSSTTNITFRDCRFRQRPWASAADWLTCVQMNGLGNVLYEYCEIDGNAFNVATNVSGYATDFQVQGSPINITLSYCWLHSAGSQNMTWQGNNSNGSKYLAQFCLIGDAGLAAGPGNAGVHGDWIYTDAVTNIQIVSMSVKFCTFYQLFYSGRPNANTQGIAYAINNSSPIYNSLNASNSSFAIAPSAQVNQYLIYSYLELSGTFNISQNYVDTQFLGSTPQWISNAGTASGVSGSQNGTRSMSGNIEMKTGNLADYGAYVSGIHTGIN